MSSPDEPTGAASDDGGIVDGDVSGVASDVDEGRRLAETAAADRTERRGGEHRPPPDDADIVRYLDADGRPLPDVDLPDVSDGTLRRMYEALVFARRFDERAVSLQRQGRIATWAPIAGQEGSQVGSTVAMAEHDYLYPTYRESAAKVLHGTDPAAVLARQRGHAAPAGVDVGDRVRPESIPIASHLPHAVGGGMASDYRDDDAVHVAHFGDGATSQGDFHEALNMAGVFDTPTVFVCHNNGWAISHPTSRQTASPTFAEKAGAYGFDGVRVDGMDPLAVYDVTRQALDVARDAASDAPRPTLVEAVEYRFGAHSTADDPTVYRDGVPDAWRARDPVPRFETFLRETGRLDGERVDAIGARVADRVAAAVDRAEAVAGADTDAREDDVGATAGGTPAVEGAPADLFEHVTADRPPELERQHEELRRVRERHGDDAFVGPFS